MSSRFRSFLAVRFVLGQHAVALGLDCGKAGRDRVQCGGYTPRLSRVGRTVPLTEDEVRFAGRKGETRRNEHGDTRTATDTTRMVTLRHPPLPLPGLSARATQR